MGSKQDVVIKNKFGTKTPGRYILRYTSRKDANESLDINDYITKYTTRYSAVEQLKYEAPPDDTIISKDESLSRKDGVLFGNEGLSYTDDMLKEAAAKTQKAADEGHVAMLPILSFSHEYLKKHNIIPDDMEEPKEAGAYKGKVDQLKLRQAVSDMMFKMHQDMGFSDPEWTATIQLDTKHVHVHATTIETTQSKPKRMKLVEDSKSKYQPDMNWQDNDRTTPYEERFDNRGLTTYVRSGKVVATQKLTKKGQPKFKKVSEPTGQMIRVEKGMINDKTKDRMRYSLTRSLTKTRDIRPYVNQITNKRQLTKTMTRTTAFYNAVTAEKLQILQASLPDNKKMWRADSNAKAMDRPHEIVNDIVDDLWTRHDNGVRLKDFDNAVVDYIDARQSDEQFDDEMRQDLYQNAYMRLRRETINSIYQDMKKLKDKDKKVEIPKYSIKATSTEALQNEIVDMHSSDYQPQIYDNLILNEQRQRGYNNRFKDSFYKANHYKKEIQKYDYLDNQNLTSEDSKVVREHYLKEYQHNVRVSDKYAYINMGPESGISKERFEEVKGSDLVDMLYDYGPKDDRSIPKHIADMYYEQSKGREDALNETLSYLVKTGQFKQYEMMRQQRDDLEKETLFANQIASELRMPTPSKQSNASLETRKTIDTFQGRKMLKDEITQLEKTTKNLRLDYEKNTNFEKLPSYSHRKKDDNQIEESVDWSKTKDENDIHQNHQEEFRAWTIRRMQFEHMMREQERKKREKEIEAELEQQRLDELNELRESAEFEKQVNKNQESKKDKTQVPTNDINLDKDDGFTRE